jgi:type III secretion protein J
MTRPRLLLLLAVVLSAACSSPVQHGLEERDANELVSALVTRGFRARKSPEKGRKPTWAVEVDDAEATEALQVLTELKLPRPPRTTTRSIVQSPGLIETPAGERLRQLEAQEGDLEEALETLGGVTQASVELAVPPAPRPGQPPTPSRAAVLLRVRPEALEHLAQTRAELQGLVAAGVDGLRAEDVVLVLDPVSLPDRPAGERPGVATRPLVVALAAGVGVLTAVLAALVALLRLQRRRPGPAALTVAGAERPPRPPASPASPRPVVSPAVQRRPA